MFDRHFARFRNGRQIHDFVRFQEHFFKPAELLHLTFFQYKSHGFHGMDEVILKHGCPPADTVPDK